MVQVVKFSCDIGDCRFEPPVCRDSVLDDEPAAEQPRRSARRRKAKPPAAAKPVPPARPTTERRHLAGADWLNDYIPRLRRAK